MGLVMNTVKIKNLIDYSKCPKFCRYNWSNHLSNTDDKTAALRRIIKSCYKDQANFERKLVWKTVRSRVHTELSPMLENTSLDGYHSMALKVMDSLRSWYLEYYREGPELCLHDLALKRVVPEVGIELEGHIDALLLEEDNVTMVNIKTKPESLLEAYKGIELKAKAWLLSQEGVIVNQFMIINVSGDTIKVQKIRIDKPKEYLHETEKVMQIITGGIKHKVFYPSVTDMCKACPYGSICS